jgi:hypothetical protein
LGRSIVTVAIGPPASTKTPLSDAKIASRFHHRFSWMATGAAPGAAG